MCAEMKKWMWNWGVVLALALPAPALAAPGSLQFFENGAGEGSTLALVGSGPFVLDLRYNASSADGLLELGDPDGGGTRPGIFDFDIIIGTTGNVTLVGFDASSCTSVVCTPITTGFPGTLRVQGSDNQNGLEGLQTLGLLSISGTSGSVEVLGGGPQGYTPFSFVRHEFTPFVLATVTPIPEPGTLLLLGVGLSGLAFLRRRSG